MTIMDTTPENFDLMVEDFLSHQDGSLKDEYYGTARDMAENTMHLLREFLFGKLLAKEERRAQYLALKAEFEGEAV